MIETITKQMQLQKDYIQVSRTTTPLLHDFDSLLNSYEYKRNRVLEIYVINFIT